MNDSFLQLRKELKVLLFFLARESENPASDLEAILGEVIEELHGVVAENLENSQRLKLVVSR